MNPAGTPNSSPLPDTPDDDPAATVIVLLAAGASRRFGRAKQLALINGEAMIHRAARVALETRSPLIVLSGAHADEVARALADLPLSLVYHPGWHDGMGSTLAAGITAVRDLRPQAAAALVWVADQPLVTSAMLSALLQRQRDDPANIWASDHQGEAGSPVIFPRDCFDMLSRWNGEGGAQALLRREAGRVRLGPVFPGMDVDTPQDLRQVRRILQRTPAES